MPLPAREPLPIPSKAELSRIREVKGGIWAGPTTRLIPDSADTRPWGLPKAFQVARLTSLELVVAMDLGIVTIDILTDAERKRFLSEHQRIKEIQRTAGIAKLDIERRIRDAAEELLAMVIRGTTDLLP